MHEIKLQIVSIFSLYQVISIPIFLQLVKNGLQEIKILEIFDYFWIYFSSTKLPTNFSYIHLKWTEINED